MQQPNCKKKRADLVQQQCQSYCKRYSLAYDEKWQAWMTIIGCSKPSAVQWMVEHLTEVWPNHIKRKGIEKRFHSPRYRRYMVVSSGLIRIALWKELL